MDRGAAGDGRSVVRRPADGGTLDQPRPLLAYMGAVIGSAIGLFCIALYTTPLRLAEVGLFAGLALCALLCVEAMRRLGAPRGLSRDLFGAWWFPVFLLLPPVYSLLIPIPVFMLLRVSVRRVPLIRSVFNIAAVGIAGVVASLVFHGVRGGSDGLTLAVQTAGVEDGLVTPHGIAWAVLCCGLFISLTTLIVGTAVQLSDDPSPWRMILGKETMTFGMVEVCVGFSVGVLAGTSMLLLVAALPPVLLLQRSLMFEQLQAAARNDPKTGLLNAATWEQEAEVHVRTALRDRAPLAVLIVDIDHFKRVNDTYGHLAGDTILNAVAATLGGQLRRGDVIGRFGGEEFVVLLREADMAEAVRIAERLRYRVGLLRPSAGDGQVTITVSVGIALLHLHGDDLIDLLAVADLALYRAKDAGRNRVQLPLSGKGMVPGQDRTETPLVGIEAVVAPPAENAAVEKR